MLQNFASIGDTGDDLEDRRPQNVENEQIHDFVGQDCIPLLSDYVRPSSSHCYQAARMKSFVISKSYTRTSL